MFEPALISGLVVSVGLCYTFGDFRLLSHLGITSDFVGQRQKSSQHQTQLNGFTRRMRQVTPFLSETRR